MTFIPLTPFLNIEIQLWSSLHWDQRLDTKSHPREVLLGNSDKYMIENTPVFCSSFSGRVGRKKLMFALNKGRFK